MRKKLAVIDALTVSALMAGQMPVPSAIPLPPRDPFEPPVPEQARRFTPSDAAEALASGELSVVEGRTLPRGYQWDGHDIPGRGKAAARRLRQLQRHK